LIALVQKIPITKQIGKRSIPQSTNEKVADCAAQQNHCVHPSLIGLSQRFADGRGVLKYGLCGMFKSAAERVNVASFIFVNEEDKLRQTLNDLRFVVPVAGANQ
jgi:hypothetical protein